MVRAKGLFHATLPVWDLARAEAFYRDLLGIERHATPSYFPQSVVFLDLGNTMIHLVRYRDEVPRPDPRSTHLAIEVDDLDAALERVRATGVTLLSEIQIRPDGMRCFYFLDPEGNRIELVNREGSRHR
ncbi:MAG TPA: VOC family protein [Chloroflexota bacterium]|nr:VOC family protein [Chloroflexota bacterium]